MTPRYTQAHFLCVENKAMSNEQAERTRLAQLGTPPAVIDEFIALQDNNRQVTEERNKARYLVSITRRCKDDWMRAHLNVTDYGY